MTMMKAVGFYQYLPISHPDSLLDIEVPKPQPKGRDLLVRVHAVSVNPVDVKVRAPKEAVEVDPKILGWDVAGVVEQVGAESTLFAAGDAVYYAGDLTRPGGNAQYHLVDERIVGRKPQGLTFPEAAGLPLTAITAWEGLFDRLAIPPQAGAHQHRCILIVGGAGGVGSMATQLAKWAGLTVVATASRPESQAWCKAHGADHVIDHHRDFRPQLQQLGIDAVDYIFCLNATDRYWAQMADVIAPQGKICLIVELQGDVNLNAMKNKSVTVTWEFMFTRSLYDTPDVVEQHRILNIIADLMDAGTLTTTVTRTLTPVTAATLRQAHALVESGSTIGKIVIEAGQ